MISESQLNREKEVKLEPSTQIEKTGEGPPVESEVVSSVSFKSPPAQAGLDEANATNA